MALAEKDCTVVLACRNLQKAEAAKADILTKHAKATVTCVQLDLSSLKSVHGFAAAFSKR